MAATASAPSQLRDLACQRRAEEGSEVAPEPNCSRYIISISAAMPASITAAGAASAAYQPQSRASCGPDPQIHHDQAGDAARRIHHHQHEDEAEIELPGLGHLGEEREADDHQHRADDRPKEEGRAAEEGEQQVGAGAAVPTTSAVAISKLIAYMPPATPAKKPAMTNEK